MQISTDLGTNKHSKKNPANLNRFEYGQRIPYRQKPIHTLHQPYTVGARSNTATSTPHHLTTTPPQLRSVTSTTTTQTQISRSHHPISDLSQPQHQNLQPPLQRKLTTATPRPLATTTTLTKAHHRNTKTSGSAPNHHHT
ncbi:hypothetical protein QL285_028323 [Trifolium repens]|nr:hypothetical protein QL285_028323 [Trifolium repens]